MKVLIVSDTHGNVKGLDSVIKREKPFDVLLHLGDVETDLEEVEYLLEDIRVENVHGNCDWYSSSDFLDLNLDGVNIFMTHGHLLGVKYQMTDITDEGMRRGADLVLFGHTHSPYYEKTKSGMILFNPGSLYLSYRNWLNVTYGVMMIENGEIKELVHKEL